MKQIIYIILCSAALQCHADDRFNSTPRFDRNIALHNELTHEYPISWQPSPEFLQTLTQDKDCSQMTALILKIMRTRIGTLYEALAASKRSCPLRNERTLQLENLLYIHGFMLSNYQQADLRLSDCLESDRQDRCSEECIRFLYATAAYWMTSKSSLPTQITPETPPFASQK